MQIAILLFTTGVILKGPAWFTFYFFAHIR